MIEVERKYEPTEDQLVNFLKDAEFHGEKLIHDLYFDYPDYRLFRSSYFLRKRGNGFELKIGDNSVSGVSEEVEGDEKIAERLKINKPLKDFVQQDLIVLIDYKTTRKKYIKEGFIIDVDALDDGKTFRYKCIEVEVQVERETQIEEAKEKIDQFIQPYGFADQIALPKRKLYFSKVKPEIYKKLYS